MGYGIISVAIRFVIKYAPGAQNLQADCLSRNAVLDSSSDFGGVLKGIKGTILVSIKKEKKEY